nr:MAG TPA: hypothetical protein [Crassvirales sp.]
MSPSSRDIAGIFCARRESKIAIMFSQAFTNSVSFLRSAAFLNLNAVL